MDKNQRKVEDQCFKLILKGWSNVSFTSLQIKFKLKINYKSRPHEIVTDANKK